MNVAGLMSTTFATLLLLFLFPLFSNSISCWSNFIWKSGNVIGAIGRSLYMLGTHSNAHAHMHMSMWPNVINIKLKSES